MTWGAVAAAALTAVLTLSGGLVLLRFQTVTKAAEERRAVRRQWHDEAVDVIVDVASFIQDAGLLALGLPLRGAGGRRADADDELIELQERWRTALRRRVQRIARGHPDSIMRTEADRIADAAIRALRIALDSANADSKFDKPEILEVFDSELIPTARSYVRCLHGEGKYAAEESASTLRRTYDIYLETGVVLKPAEISG